MLVSPVIPHEGMKEAKQVVQRILAVHMQPLVRSYNGDSMPKKGGDRSQFMVQKMTGLPLAWHYS